MTIKNVAFAVGFVFLASGCQTLETIAGVDEGGSAAAVSNKAVLSASSAGRAWVGKSSEELVVALGDPNTMMATKHQGGATAQIFVYQHADNPCYDAYVIDSIKKTVIDYYCR